MTQDTSTRATRKPQRWKKWPEEFKRVVRGYPGVVFGFVAVVVVSVVLLLLAGRQNQESTESATNTGLTRDSTSGTLNTAVLFYVAEDGTTLVQEEREVDFAEDVLARARIVAQAQLGPPPEPLISPFPDGTTLRALYLADNGDAFIDLSAEVTRAHPGGSLDELFTVYALVNALTTNLPEVSGVQILVEGQEVDTLAGHVDLRRPLALNMQWVASSDMDGQEIPHTSDDLL